MRYDAKILAKLALIFFGLLFLVCVWLGRKKEERKPPEGEKIALEDVGILLQALGISGEDISFLQEDGANAADSLTYGQYIQIYELLDGERIGLPDHANRYQEEHALLKEDWYASYRLMLAHFDQESSIWETTVFLLKMDTETKTAYTENGGIQTPYQYRSSAFEEENLRRLKVYVKGSELLTVKETLPEAYALENAWVMESTDGVLTCFYHQVEFEAQARQPVERERVADLTFRDGMIVDAREKNEKIHGRLLRMTEEEMEIEGEGVYRIAEGMEVYKLYGSLETMTRADLKIGYADTDYVIYKGRICAALISEQEEADQIRVLLKNTAKNSYYYEEVELTVEEETIRLRAEDLQVGERRSYRCSALTDKVSVHVEGIRKADDAYRGTIECYRTAEGLVLINELALEEYLYAVVPSEMPSSYPLEALKSQAVCARTYAYRYILRAGLPEFGAHVDDTTSYQVYHNSSENTATTTAVKETNGILLTYQGEPAQNYYYSTSCGVGTDAGIWQSKEAQEITYLQALMLDWPAYQTAQEQGSAQDIEEETQTDREAEPVVQTPGDLRQEETFYQFITSKDEEHLEKEEPWYRWNYVVEKLDEKALFARMQQQYARTPAGVLTKTEGEYYVSEPLGRMGNIQNLEIVRRGDGGVAEELLIETDTGSYKILSEYTIRSILCDGISEVIRQDGSTVVPKTLLPSGFFVLEAGKREGDVIGYTLIGGGYGHGVGMSQNGAKALSTEGASYRRILEYFFPGCELTGS